MNAKKSLIIFGFYAVWLAAIIWAFAHASKTIEVNRDNGIVWFAIAIAVACLGIWIAIRLNRKK